MERVSATQTRRQTAEIIVGMLVLAVLLLMLVLAIAGRYRSGGDDYNLKADFNQIDGLSIGSDVRLAGITVGHVATTRVDPKTYRANITFTVDRSVALPVDSAAIITSDSLLGGKYIALSPGGDAALLKSGQLMFITQGSISLEQLLSKFIFSVTDSIQKNDRSDVDNAGSPLK
ncbi:MAG: outer membrane lipid asymmetry maintenance protein MlaD [Acetobacteraceae bacterium]